MPPIKFTGDPIVKRLRWVMTGAILFSMILTLAGQPESFWLHPATAIRGDGLSIYNPTNPCFEFFLGRGWQLFLLASLVYCGLAFLLVSLLPRRASLIVIFSVILGHYFGGSNWLAIHWHLGIPGPSLYGMALGLLIVLSAFPEPGPETDRGIKNLRWVMLAAMALDTTVTLLGQPAGYFHHPERVHEGNSFSYFLLSHGWYAYLSAHLVLFAGLFRLVPVLSRFWGMLVVFYFGLTGFIGGSNWFFFEWRMGMQTPVLYGIILSVSIVSLAFSHGPATDGSPDPGRQPQEPGGPARAGLGLSAGCCS